MTLNLCTFLHSVNSYVQYQKIHWNQMENVSPWSPEKHPVATVSFSHSSVPLWASFLPLLGAAF